MAKQGQHKNDAHDQTKSKGHNNPDKSMTITTGSYKKPETYAEQARRHEDPGKQPQAAKNEWNEDTRDPRRMENPTRARAVSYRESGRAQDARRNVSTASTRR